MITLIINGRKKQFAAPLDIETCLREEGFAEKKIAVAVNGDFVPKTTYKQTTLKDGDEIEIVAPMQGG